MSIQISQQTQINTHNEDVDGGFKQTLNRQLGIGDLNTGRTKVLEKCYKAETPYMAPFGADPGDRVIVDYAIKYLTQRCKYS